MYLHEPAAAIVPYFKNINQSISSNNLQFCTYVFVKLLRLSVFS